MQIQEHVPLAPMTTFGIGGPARFFARVQTVDELKEALTFAKQQRVPVFMLGGGSNVLVDDTGFDGLVVHIALMGMKWGQEGDHTLVVAGAGEPWDTLVEAAVANGLWGIENLSGIPGSVGGSVVQNIGAYGAAVSQALSWVEVFDTTDRTIKKISVGECQFGYRGSIFKNEDGRYVVLRAAFALSTTAHPNVSYKDLAALFADMVPTLFDVRKSILDIRKNKFPDLSIEGTAGSFFKNPVMSKDDAAILVAKYPELPTFPLPESAGVKIPLAWFLDYRHNVLDMRTVRVGGARCFEKQPLVIVAEKNTKADDIKKLAQLIQEKIYTACAISIEPEVKIISTK